MTRLLTSICMIVLLALSSPAPSAAQGTPEGCTSIEAVIDTLAKAAPEDRAKTTLIIMTGKPAQDFIAEAVRMFGPRPGRGFSDVGTLLILRKEGSGALVMLAEGIAICPPDLMLSEDKFGQIMQALEGTEI